MNSTEQKSNAYFALTAVFIIGNTVINLPFGRGITAAIAGSVFSAILSLPFFIMLTLIQKKSDGKELTATAEGLLGKIPSRIFAIVFSAFCLLCAVACMRNFTSFIHGRLLPLGGPFLPSVIFTVLVFFLCLIPKKGVVKLSLLSLAVLIISEVVLFVFSLNQMDFDSIMPLSLNPLDVGYQGISYFAMSFAQCTVLLAFFMGEKNFKTYRLGFFAGWVVLFVAMLHTLLIFGYSYTGTLRFPYATAMSTVSIGDKFIRLEGLSYPFYFFCALIKTAVSVRSAKDVLKSITGRYTKYLPIIFCTVLIIFSIFTDFFRPLDFIKIAPFFLIPAVGLPIILLIGFAIKNRTRSRCKTR